MRKEQGFTLIEMLIALTLLGFIVSLTVSNINFKQYGVSNLSSELLAKLTQIEMALTTYKQEKNDYPAANDTTNALADATLVPYYLFPPKMPTGFDASQTGQVNGFFVGHHTAGVTPNNGYYICLKVQVANAADTKWLAIVDVGNKIATGKFYYDTACPATTNAAAPGGNTTLYPTYWLTRE